MALAVLKLLCVDILLNCKSYVELTDTIMTDVNTKKSQNLPNTSTSRKYTYMYMVPKCWPPLFTPAVM